jgi:N-acetylmuramoyl-L-alanine amidase CwlA
MFLLGTGILLGIKLLDLARYKNIPKTLTDIGNKKVQQMLLTPNEYSRPQIPLKKVKSVVVHYTANPGTTGKANRNYFENLRINKTTSASSHFVIGLKGEIIQCIPLDEISYASNDRNIDTISIECCHPDETGKFNDKTYESLIALLSWLCTEYRLKPDDIIRHYDVSGKLCPLYYVNNEDAWEKLKTDVADYMKQ